MSKIDSESISKDTITTIDDNTDDLETGHTSIESKIDTIDTNVDSVQTDTTAIKASTDTLTADFLWTQNLIDSNHTTTDALITTVDAFHDVPTKDSADNVVMSDVIGNKTDDEDGDSIYSKLYVIEKHLHSSNGVFPTGAAGETVVCGSGSAWDLGAFKEIIPVSTIASPFDIHWINIEAVSAAATYELVLYAATTEIARKRFTAVGTPNNITFPSLPILTNLDDMPANTQIQMKVMSSTGAANTVTLSLDYHTY